MEHRAPAWSAQHRLQYVSLGTRCMRRLPQTGSTYMRKASVLRLALGVDQPTCSSTQDCCPIVAYSYDAVPILSGLHHHYVQV